MCIYGEYTYPRNSVDKKASIFFKGLLLSHCWRLQLMNHILVETCWNLKKTHGYYSYVVLSYKRESVRLQQFRVIRYHSVVSGSKNNTIPQCSLKFQKIIMVLSVWTLIKRSPIRLRGSRYWFSLHADACLEFGQDFAWYMLVRKFYHVYWSNEATVRQSSYLRPTSESTYLLCRQSLPPTDWSKNKEEDLVGADLRIRQKIRPYGPGSTSMHTTRACIDCCLVVDAGALNLEIGGNGVL